MLFLAGIIITFFLAVLLFSKKGKSDGDLVLAGWLCLIGVHLALYYLQITGEIYHFPFLLGIQLPLPLFQGPFLYLYTVTVTGNQRLNGKKLLHFLPALIAYIALSKFFRLSAIEKIDVYLKKGAGWEWYTGTLVIASIISGFAYVLLSFYEISRYRKRIADEFSNTEKINLNWLRYLIIGILAIWLVILLNGEDSLIFGTAVIFVFLIGYFGIRTTNIFSFQRAADQHAKSAVIQQAVEVEPSAPALEKAEEQEEESPAAQAPNSTRVKYEKSGLQKETGQKIHAGLIQLMEAKKVYKDPDLSLAGLAAMMEVHPNILSQVINSYEKKPFYDYINELRVREVQRALARKENRQYTLLSLAFECGFNSKTAFNRNFKKVTGHSPSAYLRELNMSAG